MKKIICIGICILIIITVGVSVEMFNNTIIPNDNHPDTLNESLTQDTKVTTSTPLETKTPVIKKETIKEKTKNTTTHTTTNTPPDTLIQVNPTDTPAPQPPPEKVTNKNKAPCVYNHAYQENYESDSISQILSEAENCYVLIDPYEDNAYTQITALKAKKNIVGCYMSVGTGENWRDDFQALKPYLSKKEWGQWEGEYFVSQTPPKLVELMEARIATLHTWGCDYIEFDNMDWAFDEDNINEYDLEVTYDEAITYNQTLCAYVHAKGMKCMAKNTREGASVFDGGMYESYPNEKNWWGISGLKTFLSESKLGIVVHYNEQNCDKVHTEYQTKYGDRLSFICEDKNNKKYTHY